MFDATSHLNLEPEEAIKQQELFDRKMESINSHLAARANAIKSLADFLVSIGFSETQKLELIFPELRTKSNNGNNGVKA